MAMLNSHVCRKLYIKTALNVYEESEQKKKKEGMVNVKLYSLNRNWFDSFLLHF